MGNCLSASDPVSLGALVSRPGGPPEIQLSSASIRTGLERVAASLNAKKRDISIVAVGGAVNTLYLGTRESTGDVDFFYRTKTKHEDVTQVIVAADSAATQLRLGDNWLNNHTAIFIEEGTIQQLYDEAISQGDIIFAKKGLTVYAAPWRYALLAKLDRLSKPGARPYDMSDAVGYLAQHIKKNRNVPIKKSQLSAWAKTFKLTEPTEKLMNLLNEEYKKKTGKDGVVKG